MTSTDPALAGRHGFSGQPARGRSGDPGVTLTLSGEVIFASDGSFAGFSGRASANGEGAVHHPQPPLAAIDEALNEALRSPLDRIIDCAERIADRSDGPLRSDYAVYATDISAVVPSGGCRSIPRRSPAQKTHALTRSVPIVFDGGE